MRSIRLGEFEVCPEEGRVDGPSGAQRLEPKVMSVLVELMRCHGEVVTRQQLMDRVWTGLVVTDDAVTRCISELRTAFGDDRQAPRYVETLPKRGYRLLVAPATVAAPPPLDVQTPPVARPRRAASIGFFIAIPAAVLLVWLIAARWNANPPAPSVAIVPFVMTAEDGKDTRYFSEGLAEELLNALVRVRGLRVAARTVSFALGEKAQDPIEVGKTLGVDAVLTGTLRRAGDRLRINAQLIDARNGFHLWAESYDRGIDDLFAMQDDIATAVARTLGVGAERPVRVARMSENMEAFDYYLLGRHHWHLRTPESLERATEFFSQAIELDPDFALAHSGLADAYLLAASYGDFPSEQATVLARESVARALRLDPTLAEAHASEGMLMLHLEDYPAAERALRQAVQLNPHYAMGLMWLGNALSDQSRINEALHWYRQAQKLDPTHPVLRQNLAAALMNHGDYTNAAALIANVDADPSQGPNVVARMETKLSLSLALELGRLDDAARWANKLLEDPETTTMGYIALAEIARARNDPKAAHAWLATATAKASEPNYDLYVATLEQLALDDDARAFTSRVAAWRADAERRQRSAIAVDQGPTEPPSLAHRPAADSTRSGRAQARSTAGSLPRRPSPPATDPTALELAWQGVLESRTGDHRAAVTHLESALAQRDTKAHYPLIRLWAIGHLLVEYRALRDQVGFDRWRSDGDREAAAARAAGIGSIPYLMEEAYFMGAAGDAPGAVGNLSRVLAVGGRLTQEALLEVRLAPIRDSAEFTSFAATIDRAAFAVAAAARTCVVPCRPRSELAGVDANPPRVPVRAVSRSGDAVTQVSNGAVQRS